MENIKISSRNGISNMLNLQIGDEVEVTHACTFSYQEKQVSNPNKIVVEAIYERFVVFSLSFHDDSVSYCECVNIWDIKNGKAGIHRKSSNINFNIQDRYSQLEMNL